MQVKAIIGHLVFWLAIMALGTATIYPYYLDMKIAILDRAIFLPVWWIATYLNWWVLMPRFLPTKRIKLYALLLVVMILILTIVQRYICLFWFYPTVLWENPPDPAELNPFIPGKFIQFAAFIALPVLCSIGIRLLMGWYKESYLAKQIIAQQQTAELKYLKAQINPHFLFNTLNSLYGLSLEESKKVPGLILKLSDILSYSLYESSVEKVSLSKELRLIEDFIALEKERFGDRMQVVFKKAKDLDGALEIAPLLLIPLVENAFKHSVKEATEAVPISICLKLEEHHLIFEIKNKAVDEPIIHSDRQGLGLKNLERRLDLLYPQQHTLTTNQEGDYFCATLKLQLDE